jgi:hypothetical protein
LYLDATNAIGIDYNLAIRKLTALYSQAPSYRDVFPKLLSQYIGYGDTLVAAGQPCSAVGQYQSALSLQDNGGVVAKRDAAQKCIQKDLLTAPTRHQFGRPGGEHKTQERCGQEDEKQAPERIACDEIVHLRTA